MLTPQLYEQLYTECYAIAYSRAYSLLHSHEDAEDAVQAAFLAVWNRWPHLEPRGLCSYLLDAVNCKAIDLLRRKRPAISIEEKQIDVCVWWDVDTGLDLAAARATLASDRQELVELYYDQDCTWREINKQLDLTRGQIYKRLDKARAQLRREVAA